MDINNKDFVIFNNDHLTKSVGGQKSHGKKSKSVQSQKKSLKKNNLKKYLSFNVSNLITEGKKLKNNLTDWLKSMLKKKKKSIKKSLKKSILKKRKMSMLKKKKMYLLNEIESLKKISVYTTFNVKRYAVEGKRYKDTFLGLLDGFFKNEFTVFFCIDMMGDIFPDTPERIPKEEIIHMINRVCEEVDNSKIIKT